MYRKSDKRSMCEVSASYSSLITYCLFVCVRTMVEIKENIFKEQEDPKMQKDLSSNDFIADLMCMLCSSQP